MVETTFGLLFEGQLECVKVLMAFGPLSLAFLVIVGNLTLHPPPPHKGKLFFLPGYFMISYLEVQRFHWLHLAVHFLECVYSGSTCTIKYFFISEKLC